MISRKGNCSQDVIYEKMIKRKEGSHELDREDMKEVEQESKQEK